MSTVSFPLLTALVFSICHASVASSSTINYKYAVIIDAGSSGTRIWVYRWSSDYYLGLPRYEKVNSSKNTPGLSTLETGQDISVKITELLEAAKVWVPSGERSKTPVYLFATAGMRFLSEENASKVFNFLDEILQDSTKNPFDYASPHHARILSGEEEGVFAWIAVNYLNGALQNSSKEAKTYGILELGGASTQIAFQPRVNILADKFPVTIGSRKYPLYAHSYLHFGQEYIDLWIKEHLANKTSDDVTNIDNPCLLRGDNQAFNDTVQFVGTGDPHQCAHLLGHLVKKTNPRFCHPKPCAIDKVYQPSIHPDQTFYALSVFPMIFRDLQVLDDKNSFTPAMVFEKAYDYCKKDYRDLSRSTSQKRHKHLSKPCFIGIYTALLFTKGYGFRNESRQIIGSDVINNVTADWTLGAIIYEKNSNFCPIQTGLTGSGSSLRPSAIFISVPQLPVHLHSFFPFLQMTLFPTGSQTAVSILIYLVLGAIFKRLHSLV